MEKDRIAPYLKDACPRALGAAFERFEPLRGDASARKYYRVYLKGGAKAKTAILMEFPPNLSPLGSEEATEGVCPIKELPFVNVSRHLTRNGVRVPAIYDAQEEKGFILLEDLGDTHLFDAVNAPGGRERGLALFGKAIDEMAGMHERASHREPGQDCTAFYQRMSEKLYLWEFEHFTEYGVEAKTGQKLSESEKKASEEIFARISKELAALPAVFTHRDFHSQNILVKDGEIVLIDFQDALLAPAVYDLASLLRDRYFGLSEGEVDELLKRYLKARPESAEAKMDFAKFRRLFDFQVLQRNMKAAGRFVYLDKVKGKPHLLVHLPNLFASMKRVIASREELSPLAPMVERAAKG